ncbi:kelch-like protein 20 [Uloborus diversus]|uniref:kelch-like protein 20 n=1 Tax=Uloborus diversus TaxID=327109 RepID=UPI0024098290|nr:kelch-like protein 20 [Uloborus diversus]
MNDVGIQTSDGCVFKVHRNKLSQQSKYFLKLFEWNKQQEIILIPGICGEAMSLIINYMYTGKMPLTAENVLQILIAADYFLLEELVQYCRRFVAFSLTVKNCVSAYRVALLIERLKIEKICFRFIQVHFEEIVLEEIESLTNLPMEVLTLLIKEACLNVTNEEILWGVVTQWIKKDLTIRLRCLPHIWLHVFLDFSEQSKQDLQADFNFLNLSQDPMVLECSFDFVKNEMVETLKLLNPEKFSVKIRQPKKLYFIVKWLSFQKNQSEIYLTFDSNLDLYRKLSFCNDFFPNFVTMIDHIVFMFNSFSGENVAFDILNQFWFSLPRVARNRCSMVVLGKSIYALGGCFQNLSREFYPPVAEKYNSDLLCWEPIKPMVCNMVHAVALGGFIYALGQCDAGGSSCMIFEKYDPWCNIWHPLPAPKVTRHNFAFEVYQGAIFVLGGINDHDYLNSVEIFDPNIIVWSYGKRMLYRYTSPRVHVLEDSLVIFDSSGEFPSIYWNGNDWERYYKLANPDKYLFYGIEDSDTISKIWRQNAGQEKKWQQFIQEKIL